MEVGEGNGHLRKGDARNEVGCLLAATAETIDGVSFNLELLWERLQQPENVPRERMRSAVWAAVESLRGCGEELDAASQALADTERPRPRPEG